MTNTFYELRERGTLFDPRNLWRVVGGKGRNLLPSVVENMLDAKVELDGRLRSIINEFTTQFAGRVTLSINEVAASKADFDAVIAVRKVRDTAEKEVPFLRKKLDEYLDDTRTKETLVGAMQDQVSTNYEGFHDGYQESKNANGKGGKKKGNGKARESEIMDTDSFAHQIEAIFMVGRSVVVDEGIGSRSRSRSASVSISENGNVSSGGSV